MISDALSTPCTSFLNHRPWRTGREANAAGAGKDSRAVKNSQLIKSGMRFSIFSRSVLTLLVLICFTVPALRAERGVPTPREQFGFNIGDDYCLANYTQLAEYWHRLDRESDRMKVVNIGTSEEGRTMVMGII